MICSNSRRVALCVEFKFGKPKGEKSPKFAIAQILSNKYVVKHQKIEEMIEQAQLDRIIVMGVSGWEEGKEKKRGKKDEAKLMATKIQIELYERKDGEREADFVCRFEEKLLAKYKNDVALFKKKAAKEAARKK